MVSQCGAKLNCMGKINVTNFAFSVCIEYWNVNVTLTNLSSMAAPDIVILTTSGAASDDKFANVDDLSVSVKAQ